MGPLLCTTRRLVAACAVCLGACTAHTAYMDVHLPRDGTPRIVPLVDPLTAAHFNARIVLQNEDGSKAIHTTAILDTGASRSMISKETAQLLGLSTRSTSRIRVSGITGRSRSWKGAIIPLVQLGDLTLTDFAVGVTGSITLIGNELLSRVPIVFDRDRGIVIIDARPWNDSRGTEKVELEPGATRNPPTVEIGIGDDTVLLTLDTGAYATSLDVATADALGIPRVPLLEPERYAGIHGSVRVNYRFALDSMSFGSIRTGRIDAIPIPKGQRGGLLSEKVVGVVGMDLLGQYRLRLESDERVLELLPRRDALSTREARIARWAWAPRCYDHPGCIEASYVLTRPHDGKPGRLEVKLVAHDEYATPARFLFGFVNAAGVLQEDHPLLQWGIGLITTDEERTADLELNRARVASAWPLLARGSTVAGLVLLDVNPQQGSITATNALSFLDPLRGWQRPPTSIRIKRNAYLAGNEYHVINGQGLERCIAACELDPQCRALTYQLPEANAESVCHLLERASTSIDRDGHIAGIKPN